YSEALQLAQRTRNASYLTQATVGLSWTSTAPGYGSLDSRRRRELTEETLALLPAGDNVSRARLLAALAVDDRNIDFETRRQLADEALAMCRRLGNRAALAEVLHSWVWSVRAPETLEQRLRISDEALELAREVSDRRLECWIEEDRFATLMEAARPN